MTENLRVGTTLDSGDMPSGWDDAIGPSYPTIREDLSNFPKHKLAGRVVV
jgi:hypothetical protein